jgi:hypothetical protein
MELFDAKEVLLKGLGALFEAETKERTFRQLEPKGCE